MNIRGNRWYLLAMPYSETRYWVAGQVAERKGDDDVRLVFRTAKEVAGNVPTTLISDQASNFYQAWKREYWAKNFLHKDARHINKVAFGGRWHNQHTESFRGSTIRLREYAICGRKRTDSGILAGLRLYHDFLRPHRGLLDGLAPGEAAGMAIEGQNKNPHPDSGHRKVWARFPFRLQEDPHHTELTQAAIIQRLNDPHSPGHGRGRLQSGYPG